MVKEIEASYAPPNEAFEALLSLLKNQPPQEWHKEKEYSNQDNLKEGYRKELPENIKSVPVSTRRIGFYTFIKIGGKKFKFIIEKWIRQEKIIYNDNIKEEAYPPENSLIIWV